jgi:hypothetical protein
LGIPSANADAWNDGGHDVKVNWSIARPLVIASALFLAMLCPGIARADGGVVRLRETQGPFIITIFTPQELFTGLPTDVSVLVQDAKSSEVVMDAGVNISFVPPAGATGSNDDYWCGPVGNVSSRNAPHALTVLQATLAKASNRLLYATTAVLNGTGDWKIRVTVQRNGTETEVACTLPVSTRSSRLAGLWFYFALPAVAIALYVLNQWLTGQSKSSQRVAAFEPQPAMTYSYEGSNS